MDNINTTLDKYLISKDISGIRRVLSTFITRDQGFQRGFFDQKVDYCKSRGISENELFEEFSGEDLNNDQDAWTVEYFALQKTRIHENFSRERIEHLRKVGQKIFPSAEPSVSSNKEETKRKYRNEKTYRPQQSSGRQDGDFSKWLIPIGIGAAALILLWILFKRK
jgi:hypothetical protein